VMPALAERGIRILNHADRNGAERRWVSAFFAAEVRPRLVRVGLDPSRPFPQVANKSLTFLARLAGTDAFRRRNTPTLVRLQRSQPMFDRIRRGALVLHHPFESFEPVVRFLREAVNDPDVLAIKQTIYRAGSVSPLMDLLIEAARRGKEVMAVVELKARFEEEANINWAERLEAVGAQVVYGVVGLKTHAKLLLVTRREKDGLKRYAHLSTGNYNLATARQYTDIGYFSDDEELTGDVDAVFQQLASLGRTTPLRLPLPAPFTLHRP